MNLQIIYNIAEICARKNVRQWMLSPGSRVAPLTIALSRHPQIKSFTMSDERSAAFTAFGMAQQLSKLYHQQKQKDFLLVGLACTSGSAAYNYAPAIAEAFYQEIPLIVFTADRPPEWIDQLDGQTIRQRNIYGLHVKKSYELPVDYDHPDAVWHVERIVNEAINLSKSPPFGPVHINAPFREPFYPQPGEIPHFDSPLRIIETLSGETNLAKPLWNSLLDDWEESPKILIVPGQHDFHPDLIKYLGLLYQDYKMPIVSDTLSNTQSIAGAVRYHDIFLMDKSPDFLESLRPDLLITFGKSLISKALKLFLRKFPAREHWHIQVAGIPPDTFQSLTKVIPMYPEAFFRQLYSDLDFINMLDQDEEGEDNPYHELWQIYNAKAERYVHSFDFPQEKLTDFLAVYELLQALPPRNILHLANSMPVRYVNYVAFPPWAEIEICVNRGTSGIDGCTSTALGAALMTPDQTVVLLSGDLAFFYDRNALWNNFIPSNLRIVLLNNHSGNIFRIIEGPSQQPELEQYFETIQTLEAENTARDFNLSYKKVETLAALQDQLKTFFEPSDQAVILEIITDKIENASVWKLFKDQFLEKL
ncbi:MAG: 2-succinyl-5-enolpyruvyl-6-hydroxy-3-cyclohexene-1-carboxylic-acid synthase [Microscillaceae bacterium]|nr:2-succinyl-5-enolpyruvyl-6-hydroxy-3-cyclohexene-1-carboxylic-acid synthase [Microscillaceae bacterium]